MSSPPVRKRPTSRPRGRPHSRSNASRPKPAEPIAHGFDAVVHDPTPLPFETLPLDARIQRALEDRGITHTTPIQSAAIPLVLAGEDVIGCAQTGTGKTAAYLLPIIQRLVTPGAPRESTRVLVLAPTRELAVQVEDDFHGFAYHTELASAAVYGGVAAGQQERALKAPVDLVVATPGRLLDHMRSGGVKFDGLEVLVLDEADRMLDMGFWPSVRQIVNSLPANRQTLFFSATMSADVQHAARQIMRDPKLVGVSAPGTVAAAITHLVKVVPTADKVDWLAGFLRRAGGPTIVFVRTKRGADKVAQRLSASRIRCAPIHADLTQEQRRHALDGFRAGRYVALVATDVAARGLDIEGVAHVVNFELPDNTEAYVHRVGRTARAGESGIALTLVDPSQEPYLADLAKAVGVQFADVETSEHFA